MRKQILFYLLLGVIGFSYAQYPITTKEKNAHLIALGTAAATKCKLRYPNHLSGARPLGASEEEIKIVVLIAADVMRMSTLIPNLFYDPPMWRVFYSTVIPSLVSSQLQFSIKNFSIQITFDIGVQP